MSSEIKADKWSPASGTSATIGDSGDTYTVPSGVTLNTSSATLTLPSSVITGQTEKKVSPDGIYKPILPDFKERGGEAGEDMTKNRE